MTSCPINGKGGRDQRPWIGDANLDGEFDSGDLIGALAAGTYEADTGAVWSSGDFDGTGRFNSTDLIGALADGGYEQGPRAATAAVPEPSTAILLLIGLTGVLRFRRTISFCHSRAPCHRLSA